MFKKFITLFIVFSMVISCMCFNANAQITTGEYIPDELSYEASLSLGLGAIEAYDPTKEITLGEFARALNSIGAYDSIADNYIIKTAYENKVTLTDAVAVLCDIVGYNAIIEKDADGKMNKSHALTIAQKFDLLDGVSGNFDSALTMADLVMLVANVLEAKVLDASYAVGGGYSEIKLSNEEYGPSALGIYTTEGIVRSTSYSSLISETGTECDLIDINGVKFACEVGEYENYIGMRVKAVVKKENSKDVIKALYADCDCLRISARDLKRNEITKTSISYFDENDKEEVAKISPTADALYNYQLFRDFTAEDLKINQGALVLIDNNGDKKYDIIRIEHYKSMQIFSASVMTKKISDSYGNVISMEELIDNGYPIIENGKVINPENIPVNSIATYYMNKSGEVIRIYISSQLAGGTISGFEKDDNRVYFTDGEAENEYIYTQEIKADIEALKIGTQIMVNVNHYGEIAYFEVTNDTYHYGYMIAFDGGSGFKAPQVKMFTQDNDFKIYDVKDKVVINGKNMSAKEAFSKTNITSGLYDELGPISQIVKYKLSGKKEIKEICTTSSVDMGPERLHKEKDGVFKYYETPKTICADTRLDINTKVFLIPTDLEREPRYKYGNHSILTSNIEYTVQVYDIDDDRNAGVVVARIDPWDAGATLDDLNGKVYLVDKVGTFLADSGEESVFVDVVDSNSAEFTKQRIKFNRKEISSSLDDITISVGELRQGDMFMAASDGTLDGEMAKFKLLYRAGETEPYETVKRVWYSASSQTTFISDVNSYVAGTVDKLVKNGFLTNPKPGEYWDRIITLSPTIPVTILDTKRGVIIPASVADIQEGDTFFSTMKNAIPKGITLYR